MSKLGIKRKISLYFVNKVFCGTKYFGIKRKLLNWCGYKIGSNTKIVGPFLCTCEIAIGNECWIGKNVVFNGNGEVIIDDRCDIAPEVTFQTGTHQIGAKSRRAGKGINGKIRVGTGSWIGVRATILNDVTIGDSCVVAACACVTKSTKKNSLVGGIPARLIKELNDEEDS